MLRVRIKTSTYKEIEPESILTVAQFNKECLSTNNRETITFDLLDLDGKSILKTEYQTVINGHNQDVIKYLIQRFTYLYRSGEYSRKEYKQLMDWITNESEEEYKEDNNKRLKAKPKIKLPGKLKKQSSNAEKINDAFQIAKENVKEYGPIIIKKGLHYLACAFRLTIKLIKKIYKETKKYLKKRAAKKKEKMLEKVEIQTAPVAAAKDVEEINAYIDTDKKEKKSDDLKNIIPTIKEIVGDQVNLKLKDVNQQLKRKDKMLEDMKKEQEITENANRKQKEKLIKQIISAKRKEVHHRLPTSGSLLSMLFKIILILVALYFIVNIFYQKSQLDPPHWFIELNKNVLNLFKYLAKQIGEVTKK